MRLCDDGRSGVGRRMLSRMWSTRLVGGGGAFVVGWFAFGEIGRERLKDG